MPIPPYKIPNSPYQNSQSTHSSLYSDLFGNEEEIVQDFKEEEKEIIEFNSERSERSISDFVGFEELLEFPNKDEFEKLLTYITMCKKVLRICVYWFSNTDLWKVVES